jgi:hypothetical protein
VRERERESERERERLEKENGERVNGEWGAASFSAYLVLSLFKPSVNKYWGASKNQGSSLPLCAVTENLLY